MYAYRFDQPARFPLPAFRYRGGHMEREAALIYEGMRFALLDDGRYQIRFVVGTPAMPVTLRMQLVLLDESTCQEHTLTLPPITIPAKDQPQQAPLDRPAAAVYANIQTVHHEGYLPILANPLRRHPRCPP